MSLTEVLSSINALSREEKKQLVQMVSRQLASEDAGLIDNGQAYPVWLAHDEFAAAEVLLKMLADEKTQS